MMPSTDAHPYYVSIYEVNYGKEATFQVTAKLFIDDLEDGIANVLGVKELFIGTDKEVENADEVIMNYLSKGFFMRADGQNLDMTFIGKEVETDVMFVYLESPKVEEWKTLDGENSVLIDTISGQINVIHVQEAGYRRSYLLQKGDIRFSHKRKDK